MSSVTDLIEEPGGPREWLIRKGGYFYRPNKHGYTDVKSQAGRYTELDARREAEIEPWHMSAIHQNDVPDPPEDVNVAEIASLKARLAATQEENVRLKAELAEFDETNRLLAKHADIRRAQLGRLRKALEPFAEWATALDRKFSDHTDDIIVSGIDGMAVTFGDIRAASRSLSVEGDGKPIPYEERHMTREEREAYESTKARENR